MLWLILASLLPATSASFFFPGANCQCRQYACQPVTPMHCPIVSFWYCFKDRLKPQKLAHITVATIRPNNHNLASLSDLQEALIFGPKCQHMSASLSMMPNVNCSTILGFVSPAPAMPTAEFAEYVQFEKSTRNSCRWAGDGEWKEYYFWIRDRARTNGLDTKTRLWYDYW